MQLAIPEAVRCEANRAVGLQRPLGFGVLAARASCFWRSIVQDL